MSHLAHQKPRLLARIRRLKGQIEAVERAVEAEAACGEILHLLASVRGALGGLTGDLIEDHLREHVIDEADPAARKKGGGELGDVIRTYLK